MGVSEWFTVFSLVLAVYALYSSDERAVIRLKLGSYDPFLLLFTILTILVLIKYDALLIHFRALNAFRIASGFHSNNWALLILLILFSYFGWKLYKIPNQLPKTELINLYRKIMRRNFDRFFNLFNKYELRASDKEYFDSYKTIIFDPVFIESNTNDPYFYIEYLGIIDNASFAIFFKHLINNNNSIFYKELRSNNDSYLVNEDNVLLWKLLHEKPAMLIQIGGLKIIKDWYLVHLQNEKIKGFQSLYNQQTDQIIDDLELHFPLYLHILFIQLLYQESIAQKVDMDTVANHYGNMQSIFSNMLEKCIEGIDSYNYSSIQASEYPTNYHFLIGKIFDVTEQWIRSFNKDKSYVSNSSYVGFFPLCMRLCINELIKGLKVNVISMDFLCRMIHYHLLAIYYMHDLKEPIRKEIEDTCIAELPAEIIEPLFDYSLDEEYALSFNSFAAGDFSHPHPGDSGREDIIIERLYKVLVRNNLIRQTE
ncbi:hypothetical protein GS399_15900 [Pedobacter sp. HMF7647]|uniref:Uncharacterized protein n=1 Tax=Hufsiella arboris TaxID=2695275 RepID=A0A7K1YEK4_9SPHI|nr:hypothetical protein [Hufsiella arboris]MXV52459.1 hypothetical protein [Hufsiella arboris]